ncbi:MAG: MBL fold metallo-hydrolase [Deltaproteobacteria bacterium]|nr:MBL fold metallo-hydrolase [Deltaproteobacteria bacterium]
MKVQITTLTENTASGGRVLGEWGLSILVETEEAVVLLDTGGPEASAAHNAQRLGKDLSLVDKIVLSHGHTDHTGGLVEVLGQIRKPVEIIGHPEIWAKKYVKLPNWPERYTGIPFQAEMLESLGASFNLTREPVKITDNIMTTGEIEMQTDYEEIDDILFEKRDGELRPDMVPDDLALVINTGEGLAVITGCAHRGIINTLRHAQKITGVDYIHTVIGGTHLFRASDERLELTINDLRAFGIQRLGVSHCTGMLPAARLAQEFGDLFFFNNAGTSLTLD